MSNRYQEYCSGCGLCKSELGIDFIEHNGYKIPAYISNKEEKFCDEVCFAGKNGVHFYKSQLWGEYVGAYSGWASDNEIRHRASSGGVITAISIYLLEHHFVDAILQIQKDEKCLYHTYMKVSTTKVDVLNACGSRYCQSMPLGEIHNLVEPGKTYAFIGKPCDVIVLRNYMKIRPELAKQIKYLLSFFCAGVPTDAANLKLFSALKCNPDTASSLEYRGNGWPGKAVILDERGDEHSMLYEKSWVNILGRDIRKSCKFCFDGIGEAADISCGDLWYLNENKTPDFKERKGRNIVFARTAVGNDLLMQMQKDNQIHLEDFSDKMSMLKDIQPNHYLKRTTLYAKILALKFMRKKTPDYDLKMLKIASTYNNKKVIIKTFYGTIKRILKGKL